MKTKLSLFKKLAAATVFALLALGCQTLPPTQVFNSPISTSEDIQGSILIDARAPFEYQLSHPARSINLQWTDFVINKADQGLVFLADRGAMARRLAIYGINPQSKIIIFGSGPKDLVSMGRIAWSLRYLGVGKISMSYLSELPITLSQQSAEPYPSLGPWVPAESNLEMTAIQFDEFLKTRFPMKSESWIIDVRSSAEYLEKRKNPKKRGPDLGAINIPYEHFYDDHGGENKNLKTELAAIGIHEGDRIIVISNRGLRSAVAANALFMLGYRKVQSLSGGLWNWTKNSGN